jgi:hypothetical protein
MAYAEHTKVPAERTMSEIIKMLRKAGAHQVGQFEGPTRSPCNSRWMIGWCGSPSPCPWKPPTPAAGSARGRARSSPKLARRPSSRVTPNGNTL